MTKYVAYYRVSTQKQGQSGLGLEAQRSAVMAHVRGTLVAEITEVESGKHNDRPKLNEALRLCRAHKAVLVIAKLDRLGRNIHFISGLMDAGVKFIAVDCPEANELTLHIMAVMAQHEAKMISDRTRAALAAARARGVKLGGNRGQLDAGAREAGRKAHTANANARAAEVLPIIKSLQVSGLTSLSGIAQALNDQGVSTVTGRGVWSPCGVSRVLARMMS